MNGTKIRRLQAEMRRKEAIDKATIATLQIEVQTCPGGGDSGSSSGVGDPPPPDPGPPPPPAKK